MENDKLPMPYWIIIIGPALAIVMVELVMLRCFEVRHRNIEFPRCVDRSFFRFFTLWRFRAVIIIHTILMAIVVGLSFSSLW